MRSLRRAVWLAYISLKDHESFYHLVTATRGPDPKWRWLKWFFTAWIRWHVLPVPPYWADARKGRILMSEVFEVIGELRKIKSHADELALVSLEHFLGHIKWGLQSMRRVPWLKKEERAELEVLLNLVLLLESSVNVSEKGIEGMVWQWWNEQYLPIFEGSS